MAKTFSDITGRIRDGLGVFLADADLAALANVYKRAAGVSTTGGDGILINASVAGTVTLGMAAGGSVTITVPVGTTILPLSVVSAAAGTSTGAAFSSLFFT